jgi:GNAT superfamily N-acetyltransferase
VLIRARAGLDDALEFASFECWDGDASAPWIHEVQNYIRGHLLWRFENITLAFRDEGRLVAVASFYPSTIGLPLVKPIEQPSWHLDVLAVQRERQRAGLAGAIFEQTFAVMRDEDPERVLVIGFVQRDNIPSFTACERAGLMRLIPRDGDYWIVLGEIPE